MHPIVPIEQELQRQPPRTVKHRRGLWGELSPYMIFLLPHVWIAFAAPVFLALMVLLAVAAEPFPGEITDLQIHHTRKTSTTRNVTFKFQVGNETIQSNENVPVSLFETLHRGTPVTVYALRLMPSFSPQLEKGSSGIWGVIAFMTLWSTFWCGIMFTWVWFAIVPPLRNRHLVKYGTAVIGTMGSVIATNTSARYPAGVRPRVSLTRQRIPSYTLPYSFEAKLNDDKTGKVSMQTFHGRMKLKAEDYETATEMDGQSATVLFDKNNPKSSIIYRFGNYTAL